MKLKFYKPPVKVYKTTKHLRQANKIVEKYVAETYTVFTNEQELEAVKRFATWLAQKDKK